MKFLEILWTRPKMPCPATGPAHHLLRLLVKPKEFHACEVAPRAPQNVRSAPAGQHFLGKPQEFHENHWNSWKCAGISWRSKEFLVISRNFLGVLRKSLDFEEIPLEFNQNSAPVWATFPGNQSTKWERRIGWRPGYSMKIPHSENTPQPKVVHVNDIQRILVGT